MQLAYGEKIPDCTRCDKAEELRAEYGCDAPARAPVLYVTCSACWGRGCEVPEGTPAPHCEDGSFPLYRCPGKLVEGRRDVQRVFWHLQQDELPAAGGLADQAGTFIEARRIYQHERGVLERERAEKEERERIRREKLAGRTGAIRG